MSELRKESLDQLKNYRKEFHITELITFLWQRLSNDWLYKA